MMKIEVGVARCGSRQSAGLLVARALFIRECLGETDACLMFLGHETDKDAPEFLCLEPQAREATRGPSAAVRGAHIPAFRSCRP
jgi:hypothetical protein